MVEYVMRMVEVLVEGERGSVVKMEVRWMEGSM